MVTGIDVWIWKRLYGTKGTSGNQVIAALSLCGIPHELGTNFPYAGWYIVAVPSLNVSPGGHMLMVYLSRNQKVKVLDPTCGPYKYTRKHFERHEVKAKFTVYIKDPYRKTFEFMKHDPQFQP